MGLPDCNCYKLIKCMIVANNISSMTTNCYAYVWYKSTYVHVSRLVIPSLRSKGPTGVHSQCTGVQLLLVLVRRVTHCNYCKSMPLFTTGTARGWVILVGGHLSSSLSLLNSLQDLKWTAMLLELHPSHVIQCYQSTQEAGLMTALLPICVQLLQLSELTLPIACLSTTAVRTIQVRCCVWLHILYNFLSVSFSFDLTYSPERLLQGICQYPIISATATAMSCQPSVNPFCKQVFTLGNTLQNLPYVYRFTDPQIYLN